MISPGSLPLLDISDAEPEYIEVGIAKEKMTVQQEVEEERASSGGCKQLLCFLRIWKFLFFSSIWRL